jgi:hypothetical protein
MMSWILLVAALIVSWLIFTWLLNVIKTTVATALTIALIALALQLAFGIGPQQLLDQVKLMPQLALEQLQNLFGPKDTLPNPDASPQPQSSGRVLRFTDYRPQRPGSFPQCL